MIALTKTLFAALFLIVALLTLVCVKASAHPSPRTVLILDDSDPDSPFSRHIREQVHSTLDQELQQGYAIYTEFLNLGHFLESNYDRTLHAYLKNKYRDKTLGAIVAIGSVALKFSLKMRTDAWASVPVVFVIFDNAFSASSFPLNATGIIAPRRFRDLVKAARMVVPGLTEIAVVGDSIERQPYRRHYQEEMQQFTHELSIVDLTELPLGAVKSRIAALPNNAAIAYIPMFGDETGVIHNPGEALRALAEVANRPIVVDSNIFIGEGATGGIVPSATNIGREVGVLTARIFNGEAATGIPIEVKDSSKPEFDARQLERWNIAESSLPAGSNIRFKSPTAWELYRWQIVSAAVVIAMQGFIIGWLLIEHRRRQKAERESHQHLLEVAKMDRAMTASAMSASIGHEVIQPIAAILNNAETARVLLNEDPSDQNELREILTDIQNDGQRAADIIKHLRALLKRDELEARETNLSKVLNDTLRLLRAHAKDKDVAIRMGALPSEIQIYADRVHIQQVILNTSLNAIDALQEKPPTDRSLDIQVTQLDDEIMISVADNGPGIPNDKLATIFEPFVTTKQQGTGLGLSIAKTIIHAYGGRIWAENNNHGGATFNFTLKMNHAKAT